MRWKKAAHPLLGTKVRFTPQHMSGTKEGGKPVVTGTVVWVHPKERYVMVEYGYPKSLWRPAGKIRECLLWHGELQKGVQYA